MRTIEFLSTSRWIFDQYTEETHSFFKSIERVSISSDSNTELLTSISKFLFDIISARSSILSNPIALDILNNFNMSILIDDMWQSEALTKIATINSNDPDNIISIIRDMSDLRKGWGALEFCLEPIRLLTIPDEIYQEEDFNDILTIEFDYLDDNSPSISNIIDTLSCANSIYRSINRIFKNEEAKQLTAVYISSGSKFSFDFKGIAEPIKQFKELIVEAWQMIRHGKSDKLRSNSQAALESLAVVERIGELHEDGSLSSEEAHTLKTTLIDSTIKLFENGASIREIPNTETISNQALLSESVQPKLLPETSSNT